jgi:hypothetical protein
LPRAWMRSRTSNTDSLCWLLLTTSLWKSLWSSECGRYHSESLGGSGLAESRDLVKMGILLWGKSWGKSVLFVSKHPVVDNVCFGFLCYSVGVKSLFPPTVLPSYAFPV